LNGSDEVSREFVVARCDAPPVLEPTEHALDQVSALVQRSVEGMAALAGRVVGDDGCGPAPEQEVAQIISIISSIGGTYARRRQGCQQGDGDGRIAALARRHFEGDGSAEAVADSMDFRAPAATRAADGLRICPPFPPAAARCALAVVESMAWKSSSGETEHNASNSFCQTLRRDQRFQRL